MRIPLLALPFALLAAPVVAQDLPATVVPSYCKPGADKARSTGPIKPRTLGEMPSAKEYKTVWRTDARGCPKPVVSREGIGNRQP